MKYLEAKRAREMKQQNKMLPGPSEDKALTDTPPGASVRPDIKTLAAELGVDLSTVVGTGRDGRITLADVRTAGKQQGAS